MFFMMGILLTGGQGLRVRRLKMKPMGTRQAAHSVTGPVLKAKQMGWVVV
jgi:hypothetical protein